MGLEKTAQLLAKKMNDPNSYKINLNALKSVDVTQPRIDMPSNSHLADSDSQAGQNSGGLGERR